MFRFVGSQMCLCVKGCSLQTTVMLSSGTSRDRKRMDGLDVHKKRCTPLLLDCPLLHLLPYWTFAMCCQVSLSLLCLFYPHVSISLSWTAICLSLSPCCLWIIYISLTTISPSPTRSLHIIYISLFCLHLFLSLPLLPSCFLSSFFSFRAEDEKLFSPFSRGNIFSWQVFAVLLR